MHLSDCQWPQLILESNGLKRVLDDKLSHYKLVCSSEGHGEAGGEDSRAGEDQTVEGACVGLGRPSERREVNVLGSKVLLARVVRLETLDCPAGGDGEFTVSEIDVA